MTGPARPAYDPDEAEENSRRKAKVLARYAYRHGLTFMDLGDLPYAVKGDRKAPSLRRFAAAAYRDAGVTENVPHSRTAGTWTYLRAELADLEDRAAYGMPGAPTVDLLERRGDWVRQVVDLHLPEPDGPADEIPADTPAPDVGPAPQDCAPTPTPPVDFDPAEAAARLAEGDRLARQEAATRRPRRLTPASLAPYAHGDEPALITSGSRPVLPGDPPAPRAPRGWDVVAALPPLDPAESCRWCGQPAVIGTLNGWRCPAHPPVRGDSRGDWGWAMNWAAAPGRSCPPTVCWCGRHPHYTPASPSLPGMRALTYSHGFGPPAPRVDAAAETATTD